MAKHRNKNKKDSKVRKELMLKQKRYLKKYPWFSDGDLFSNKRYSSYVTVPKGWMRSFGSILLKELDKAIKKYELNNYCILQIKEKYGSLRWYDYGGNNATSEIVGKFENLSQNICLICGKPDVGYLKHGWIYPVCKSCYKKTNYKIPYEEAIDTEDTTMSDTYTYRTFKHDEIETVVVDCSEYARMIRNKWYKRR